jgi:uncharacterized membrane protein
MSHPTRTAAALTVPLLLAACGGQPADGPKAPEDSARIELPAATPAPSPTGTAPGPTSAAGWDLQSSGEGAALVFPASGKAAVRLFCPTGAKRILVNVPAFRPIGSEERLSFGSGGNAHALVADTRGDRQRGGVSGTGAVPGNLGGLIGGPVSVSYGAQVSGPHPAPPANLARAFAAACREGAPKPTPTPTATVANVSPCLVQDGERLSIAPLRAVGTEPFWGARIEGRCVTYSHPDDQQGTRVWTRYTERAGGGGTWSGALGGKPFVLTTRAQTGCSDGMSDKRYPIAVALTVGGEGRTGCAEPR